MGLISPINLTFPEGRIVTIRSALPDDAAALIAFGATLTSGGEPFGLMTPADFAAMSVADEQARIECLRQATGGLILVAAVDGQVIGLLQFRNGVATRHAHQGALGIFVHRDWQGRGIGQSLMSILLVWTRAHPLIEKVCLEVFATNTAAIALYRKMGFVEEGRRRQSIKLESGAYIDELLMAVFVKSTSALPPTESG